MIENFKKYFALIIFAAILFIGCSKDNGGGGGGNPTPTPTPIPPSPTATTCIISGISQVNSGTKSESNLTIFYDNNYNVTRIVNYDSLNNKKYSDVNFTYVTSDSIRIDAFQYIKLDAGKRVIVFVTKSDLVDPANADNYRFEYFYNSQGYLETKNLYINGSKLPNFKTIYIYTNNQLTKCIMTAASSANQKVLESDLTYNNSITLKTWIYPFPDAIEGYMYPTVLNFGNRPANPLQQVVTKIYNSSTGALLDTWTTNYGGYKMDANGYLIYGVASGDLQEGIASFYGKTNFYYACH